MPEEEAVRRIKSYRWDNRVRRAGFLQSKQIVVESKVIDLPLTPSVSVFDGSNVWIKDYCAYNLDAMDEMREKLFPAAFDEDSEWPLRALRGLEEGVTEAKAFIRASKETDWEKASAEEKVAHVRRYVTTSAGVQKYYAIAVSLTNYCEEKIREKDESLLEYAVQYQALDIDEMNASLLRIKEAVAAGDEARAKELIATHCEEYGWIKNTYNITEPYTEEDVRKEIASDIHVFEPQQAPEGPLKHLVVGLQVGIYLRNRMKELSQELWHAWEWPAKAMAHGLGISREDFLQLHYKEAIASLEAGKLTVEADEIQRRHEGFIVGTIDRKEILITGPIVEELSDWFGAADTAGLEEVRGTVACKGHVVGTAKVILNIKEIGKLEPGDILVTSMTTPDFIVAMKQASAIVTDEGGLSCHAAIVSREMKKPCVIGTKLATKVFKDGDRIEVDAERGVVKKLKT